MVCAYVWAYTLYVCMCVGLKTLELGVILHQYNCIDYASLPLSGDAPEDCVTSVVESKPFLTKEEEARVNLETENGVCICVGIYVCMCVGLETLELGVILHQLVLIITALTIASFPGPAQLFVA